MCGYQHKFDAVVVLRSPIIESPLLCFPACGSEFGLMPPVCLVHLRLESIFNFRCFTSCIISCELRLE
ncbi:hypothetical protein CH282_01445 [Rhodococcus sp. 06-418-1B]|nr:hypothetical protein CH282_01445 [Rhodococcus sp. 06-418-1B]